MRELYQAIIQLAVACHHLQRGNYRGALYSVEGALQRMERFPSPCRGIAVNEMQTEAQRMRDRLVRLGPTRMREIEPAMMPRLEPVEASGADQPAERRGT